MNPEKLSLLSDKELTLLAERLGIYIPEGLDRPFVMEEVLGALEDDDREEVFSHDGTGHVEEKKLSGSTYSSPVILESLGIPERYNDTMIRALPRDPSWIYAYWDISERKRAALLEEDDPSGLCLRVIILHPQGDHRKDFFDIGVTLDDWKWYINIPQPGSIYRVDLCLRKSDRIKVLARSNEVKMPIYFVRKTHKSPQITKSLLILSGIEGLHLAEPADENPARIISAEEE
ncbi:MAG: DUF4912 domain-containing protein [Spirochaetes bacterium]|nr:DUF4912 domain-containing protein [Spirochaetota bacterium]